MNDKSKISFSLRKLLVVPIIFAVFFALFRQKEAAIFAFTAATGSSLLLFLINKDNLRSIVLIAAGCLLGGFAALTMTATINGSPMMSEELVKITIGVVCGYFIIKVLNVFERVFDKLDDSQSQERDSIDNAKTKSVISEN